MSTFQCFDCRQVLPVKSDGGTGYATLHKLNEKVCYVCCAKRDRVDMRKTGRATLYLVKDREACKIAGDGLDRSEYSVTNWPGTLSIRCPTPRKSRHNIARWRYDVWFSFEGETWHGVTYGDNTQICHCRRTKAR